VTSLRAPPGIQLGQGDRLLLLVAVGTALAGGTPLVVGGTEMVEAEVARRRAQTWVAHTAVVAPMAWLAEPGLGLL